MIYLLILSGKKTYKLCNVKESKECPIYLCSFKADTETHFLEKKIVFLSIRTFNITKFRKGLHIQKSIVSYKIF